MKTRTAANKRRSRFVGGGVRQLYPNFIFTESPSASEVIQTSFTEKTLHYQANGNGAPLVSYTPTNVMFPSTLPEDTPNVSFYPSSTPNYQNKQSSSQYAVISNEISYAAIRKSEGYQNKDDTIDIVARVPSGDTVEIIGGPNHTDGLVWWYVSWHGYQGWMADHTASGKTTMEFRGPWIACPEAIPSRLHIGDLAMVGLNGLANHLRTDHGTSATVIGHLEPGVRMRVLDGPACNHNMVWWYVQPIDVSYGPGWTSEGSDDYWLVPIQP